MISIVNGLLTLLLIIVFVGIWIWAWSGRNKAVFEEMARMPLEDESPAAGESDAK